jgi:hypothetical protein
MKRSLRPIRTVSKLPRKVHQHLNSYALAAGAAGVSLLALTAPADAEIVYTPAHITVGRGGSGAIDLNNDGHVDFTIVERSEVFTFSSVQILSVQPAKGNEVECPICSFTQPVAAALHAGSRIGGGGGRIYFASSAFSMANRLATQKGEILYGGSWNKVSDRYLGLKFHLNDGAHFGWARLNVEFHGGDHPTWRAQITGYAYETTPNTPIDAGQIQENSDATTQQGNSATVGKSARPSTLPPLAPADGLSLGSLALGSDGIRLWRREE